MESEPTITPEECAALAAAFEDDFEWDGYELQFNLGTSRIGYEPAAGDLEWAFVRGRGDYYPSPALGLAALTAKCKEIVLKAGRGYTETKTGVAFHPEIMERDSAWEALIDWAALLAAKDQPPARRAQQPEVPNE